LAKGKDIQFLINCKHGWHLHEMVNHRNVIIRKDIIMQNEPTTTKRLVV